ncbi:MAG TPA: protease complex subunit PrcB family protein [Thermoanaerobaculia bacterium]|nr:protease complex subunit PrcB family protein [Thermoanaerobaculia bacterium]
MKRLMLLPMLALVTACAAAGAGGALETRVITEGGYAAGDFPQPQAMAARDQETLQRLWKDVGQGTPPPLGENETVVFLFAGSRPTGGWSIQPPAAKIENGILVIEAAVQGPPAGAMVTQAFTSPYLVLTVNTRTFDDLLWKR